MLLSSYMCSPARTKYEPYSYLRKFSLQFMPFLPECIPCNLHAEGTARNLCGSPKTCSLIELEILYARKGKFVAMLLCSAFMRQKSNSLLYGARVHYFFRCKGPEKTFKIKFLRRLEEAIWNLVVANNRSILLIV